MGLDTIIQKNAVVFSILLSGMSFFGLYTHTDNIYSASVFSVLVLAAGFIVFAVCERISHKAVYMKGISKLPAWLYIAFNLLGAFSCIAIYSAFTVELSDTLPFISGEFEGGRFSFLFVAISLVLALYMGKREMTSIERICLLLLPVIALPYFLTAFDFIGHMPDIYQLLPTRKMSFDIKYILHPVCMCCGIIAMFPLINCKTNAVPERKSSIHGFLWAFVAMALFCILEYSKYVMWFGQEGVEYVIRPDRTMLSQVPFMNVQELHILSYYTAYMLKISLFCTCARKYFEKMLIKAGFDEDAATRTAYITVAFFAIFSYAVLVYFKNAFVMVIISFSVLVIFAVIILQALLKIAIKRHFKAKMRD